MKVRVDKKYLFNCEFNLNANPGWIYLDVHFMYLYYIYDNNCIN
jgi:hypothetical protein